MTDWRPQIDMGVMRDRSLTGTACRLYTFLAYHADRDTGECYPKHETLADDIGATTKTIERAIESLMKAGHVVDTNRRKRGVRIYQLPTDNREARWQASRRTILRHARAI